MWTMMFNMGTLAEAEQVELQSLTVIPSSGNSFFVMNRYLVAKPSLAPSTGRRERLAFFGNKIFVLQIKVCIDNKASTYSFESDKQIRTRSLGTCQNYLSRGMLVNYFLRTKVN